MSLMFCTNCGHELSEGESVCPNCGAKIISDDYSIDEQLELLKEEPVVEEKVVEEVKVTEVPVVEEKKVTVDEKEDKKKAKEEEKKRKKQEKEDAKNRKRQEKEEKKKKRQQEKEDRKNKKKQDKEDKKTEVPVVEEKKVEEKPKKVKKDPNLESGMVKTLKSILALVAIIALLTCTVLALILKFPCEMTSDEINYLEFIGENFKLLDGAKLSVNLVSLLIFNVVLPLCFIIILFIKQLIISIGREYGSAGHEIGQKLADKLGIELFDRNLLDEISQIKSSSYEDLARYDEKPKRFFTRTVRGYSNSPELNVAELQFALLKSKAADDDSFVVVGRCTDKIFKGIAPVLSVFITADLKDRITRIEEVRHLSEKEALKKIEQAHSRNLHKTHDINIPHCRPLQKKEGFYF